ncbi:putative sugar nucleotidyl transferase [Balneolaceae bacterium ANBcel3]|nr:putative sugar nucleotidyl transferase [Balneolaceae bacterium ANBcel3]
MVICFFQAGCNQLFAPLTLTRPTDDLRIGICTIREKWELSLMPEFTTRIPEKPWDQVFSSSFPDNKDEVMWINPRWLPCPQAVKEVLALKPGQGLAFDETLVAVCADSAQSREWFGQKISKPDCQDIQTVTSGTFLGHLSDLFLQNGQEIIRDIERLGAETLVNPDSYPGAFFCRPDHIYMEGGVQIDAGAVIDATNGPVYLGEGAHIMSGAVVRGPAAICRSSVVKVGGIIYEETTIGPVCKVAGEIQNSILHSHSNKAHDGFLGNSLLGEWCNLGAGTTTSNLKNNYKPVNIPDWETGEKKPTALQFFGTVMGDHSKTAIQTRLSAGTLCGVSCNIFTDGFAPGHIPSFSWVSPSGPEPYHFDKAVETAEAMMRRRKVPLTDAYRQMLRYIYDSGPK